MLTEKQIMIIAKLKYFGYGWREFAISVEASNRCSPKQEDTMIKMLQRVQGLREYAEKRKSWVKSYNRTSNRGRRFIENLDLSGLRDCGYEGHPGQFDAYN